jgi:hypothetical protein
MQNRELRVSLALNILGVFKLMELMLRTAKRLFFFFRHCS